MTLSGTGTGPNLLATAVRRELLRLAAREDDLAATEAASVPYWAPSGTAAPSMEDDLDQLLLAIRRAGGSIRTVSLARTHTPSSTQPSRTEPVNHDDLNPEEAAELAAWWIQAFEALHGQET